MTSRATSWSRTSTSRPEDRARFSVSDDDVLKLAEWAMIIEDHYTAKRGVDTPMDIEWAKDGIRRANSSSSRPVRRRSTASGSDRDRDLRLQERARRCVTGLAVGDKIATGTVRVIPNVSHIRDFQPGEILVTDITDPDWEPIMKKAAAIVTNRGGRTSHAAIVSRELGIPGHCRLR